MGHSSLPIWKSLGTSLASLMMTSGMGGLSLFLSTVVFSLSRETKCSLFVLPVEDYIRISCLQSSRGSVQPRDTNYAVSEESTEACRRICLKGESLASESDLQIPYTN